MEICDFTKVLPKDYNLYFPSDWHVGTRAFYENGAKKEINIIQEDPIGYAIFMGDAGEFITKDDKRHNQFEHTGAFADLMSQVDYIGDLMLPAKDKFLAILYGYHEYKVIVRGLGNPSEKIANKLGGHVKFPGFTMVAKLPGFKFFGTHGSRNTNHTAGDRQQRENNEAIWVKKYLRDLQGDCLVMGVAHIHKMRIRPPLYELSLIEKDGEEKQTYPKMLVSQDGVIHEDCRWYFSTGALRKLRVQGITTYSEIAGYSPTELGMIKLLVRDNMPVGCEKVIV